ncbi:MAG TPA: tRNA pseudouridine(54/55) synthase Pus10 [Thermoplasmata archaeon]|nr:tRNA pseudouridine(54/55) synthase Pus10 [Thermoplasmata archaeon]
MDEILAAARAVDWAKLGERGLCDACLGRLFGKLGHGHTNEQRGAAIRGMAPAAAASCWLCQGLTSRYEALAGLVAKKLEAWGYDTFLIGSKVDPELQAREESLWADLSLTGPEPMKSEVNREVGKRVCDLTGKEPSLTGPDILAIVDTSFDHVDLVVNPLFLRGRYRKLVRGIPQTRWPCNRCRGKGCAKCGGTGKMYATSVEEILAAEVMRETGGSGHALHGMGREDIDARMLGSGRPFVLEIKEPRKRQADLAAARDRVNASGQVEVNVFTPATRHDVLAVKSDRADKEYRVLVRFASPVDEASLKKELSILEAQPIAQRTPTRVVHRRADTTRHRAVKRAELLSTDGTVAELRVTAEAGSYIKELVHGDRGRTKPSLADLLGVACEVLELDVTDVHDSR